MLVQLSNILDSSMSLLQTLSISAIEMVQVIDVETDASETAIASAQLQRKITAGITRRGQHESRETEK